MPIRVSIRFRRASRKTRSSCCRTFFRRASNAACTTAACIDITGIEPLAEIMRLTDGAGVDCAVEAVGVPATFELCQQIVAAGGTIANVGVHGVKADIHLESLWDRNITITTRLVDTVST